MHSATRRVRSTAHVIREAKATVSGRFQLCMMDQMTNCGVMLDTESTDERLRGKRAVCLKDYEMLRGLKAAGALKWHEAVALGFCRGTKEAEKKVLRAISTYRQQMEEMN